MLNIIVFAVEDTALWFGLYFLFKKSHLRHAKKENFIPELRTLKICFIVSWIVIHIFCTWLGYELVKLGGMN
ncbi:MAG: hypothetical protein K2J40_03385 [Ruminococcus sp.]|nr:hypothetical protein [Ruminococcus sp.]